MYIIKIHTEKKLGFSSHLNVQQGRAKCGFIEEVSLKAKLVPKSCLQLIMDG